MKPNTTLAVSRKETNSNRNVVASVEFVLRTALHDSAEADFVPKLNSDKLWMLYVRGLSS
jgi:hypothetical protein